MDRFTRGGASARAHENGLSDTGASDGNGRGDGVSRKTKADHPGHATAGSAERLFDRWENETRAVEYKQEGERRINRGGYIS